MPVVTPAAIWLPQSPVALVLLAIGAMGLMYLGRSAIHAAIRVLAGAVHDALILAAGLVMSAHDRLAQRNREVLLEMGRETAERLVEREFHRVNAVVARDLSGYPALNRRLADQIARIDEDYLASTDVPPAPPAWTQAVETISSIPARGDPLVGRILGDIHKTLASAHEGAMREYRRASCERHRLLHRMLPLWRRLDQTLSRVDGTIRGLVERSRAIDAHMEHYEQVLAGSDAAVRTLSASSFTNFATAALVLVVACLGGFINFHLIALPMSEMVGGASHVGPVQTSDIAALVIILTEIAMGLFLMESLRVTRMFPVIRTLDDQMRRRLGWAAFGLLLTLSCVEASLAYMRDLLAADREALRQALAGAAVVEAQFRWIPSIGQMVMGLVLPFALCFAAIPLESFIQSGRVVGGATIAVVLRGVAGALELLGSVSQNLVPILTHAYDFVIILPLRLEHLWQRRRDELERGRRAQPEVA